MSEESKNVEQIPATSKDTELAETDLEQVAGGAGVVYIDKNITQDVTLNKAKAADKAYAAMDAYIKG